MTSGIGEHGKRATLLCGEAFRLRVIVAA